MHRLPAWLPLITQERFWKLNTAPLADPLPRLLAELIYSSPQVTLAFVYLAATLLRSWVREFTNSWQAVLNIVGGQGLGKTTLARRLLMDALQKPANSQVHQRIWNNFIILDSVFQLLCFAASEAGMALDTIQLVRKTYKRARNESYTYQKSLLNKLDAQKKKGNLAAVLLEGFEKGAFKLTTKIGKLEKRDGIIWNKDLCLRREALERFVRLQDGYGTYTIFKIVQELKDIGALVLQEEGTAQVKLKKNTPRVYRLRLDVLKSEAKPV